MSILVGKGTRLLTQGITGDAGKRHSLACREYGTNVVGGVTPGRGGTNVEGIPVFDTVADAVAKTGANATMIFVPPPFAADAVYEAVDAEIPLIVCITEGIPALDEVRIKAAVTRAGLRLDRAELPRRHHARRGQGRDHARLHPHAGQGRRRVAFRHAHVRGRLAADEPRARARARASASAATP